MTKARRPRIVHTLDYNNPLHRSYRHACMLLLSCQYAYYHYNISMLEDSEYDFFNNWLIRFEKERPLMKDLKSPTYSLGSEMKSSYPISVTAWVDAATEHGKKVPAVDREAWHYAIIQGLPVMNADGDKLEE